MDDGSINKRPSGPSTVLAWNLKRVGQASPSACASRSCNCWRSSASRGRRAMSQRHALRALHRAQERARKSDGTPTFPQLFEHDDHGHLVVSLEQVATTPTVPATCCANKNTNVANAVHRRHFTTARQESPRASLEARHGDERPGKVAENGEPGTSQNTTGSITAPHCIGSLKGQNLTATRTRRTRRATASGLVARMDRGRQGR